jgi:NTE family protein
MQYDLIFEAGGARSIVFTGAMQELEEHGHTFDRLIGTSAGGIAALLFAAGYHSNEAMEILYNSQTQETTFANFLSEPDLLSPQQLRDGALRTLLREIDLSMVPNFVEEQFDSALLLALTQAKGLRPLLSFLERGYWYSDLPFQNWIISLLDRGTFRGRARNFSSMTLEEFYQATEVELSLIASDVTEGRVIILNHRTAPDCPLLMALRMTAGLPLLWPEIVWLDAWGTYTGEDISGHVIVDGEVLSPFPIELLLSDRPEVTAWIGAKKHPHVLGLLIDETLPFPGAPPLDMDKNINALRQLPTISSVLRTIDSVVTTRSKMTINAVEQHIVRLPTRGYQMLEFKMSRARFDALVTAGRKAMQRYFAEKMPALLSGDPLVNGTSALAYINDSATQQLSQIIYHYHINTGGGPYIEGNVQAGGDFIGRDRTSISDKDPNQ